MPQFRKKPVVIDAVRWTGQNVDEAMSFIDFDALPSDGVHVHKGIGHTVPTGELHIPTLEGTMTASPGDWIIRGVVGEYYPCKPDVFETSYEPVQQVANEAGDKKDR